MPAGDRTGPRGLGAMTGRAAGYCTGYEAPGYGNPGFGGGFGWGRGFRGGGRGLGRGNRAYGAGFGGGRQPWGGVVSYQDQEPKRETTLRERQALKKQARALQVQLDAVSRRLEEIEQAEVEDPIQG